MGESIEELLENLRKKADVTLVAYQIEGEGTYRATGYFWPGTGSQVERREVGPDLRDVLLRLTAAIDKAKSEAA